MHRNPWFGHVPQDLRRSEMTGERVYRAVKAKVVACEFPAGKRIYLGPLAQSLGVSTTPVREALARLAARQLVAKAPRRGFYAIALTEDRLAQCYRDSRALLLHELESLTNAHWQALALHQGIAAILVRLKLPRKLDGEILAQQTAKLFLEFASLRPGSVVLQAIDIANDRLHYIRTLEFREFRNTPRELLHICELMLTGDRIRLARAIDSYHRRRLSALPRLMQRLERMK